MTKSCTLFSIVSSAAFGLLVGLGIGSSAYAASCLTVGAASPETIGAFSASPGALLNNATTDSIATQVRTLVASETDLTNPMLTLAGGSGVTPSQISSIGAGLGRAAAVCKAGHPELADAISQAIAAAVLQNPALAGLQVAFLSASTQFATAALGPAGAPGAGVATAGDIAGATADDIGGGTGGTGFEGIAQNASSLSASNDSGGGQFTIERTQFVSPTTTQ